MTTDHLTRAIAHRARQKARVGDAAFYSEQADLMYARADRVPTGDPDRTYLTTVAVAYVSACHAAGSCAELLGQYAADAQADHDRQAADIDAARDVNAANLNADAVPFGHAA